MEDVPGKRGLMNGFEAEYNDDGDIIDFVSGEVITDPGPEEEVRQWYETVLVEEYNYKKSQIETEFSIKMGSTTKSADIAVFKSSSKDDLKLIVETKKPDRSDGIDQLKSYMEADGVSLGAWTNGADIQHLHRPEPREFESISDIPEAGENLASMDSRIRKEDLSPASDLASIFEQCEDEVIAHQGGVDVFDELFKIILTKIYDEVENLHSPDAVAEFRAGPMEDPSQVATRIRLQFQGSDEQDIYGVKRKYDDVFEGDEEINLSDENIYRVVGILQNTDLMETNMDVLGSGFEALVPNQMKQDKGQYFTPRHVVKMTTELVGPKRYEDVLDPACGSGGFLVYVMKHLRDKLLEERGEDNFEEVMELVRDYASNRAYGLDYDQRLVRVAKAYMVIWGDGRSNVRQVQDSLRYFDWPGEIQADIQEEGFDIVLTNPPFAGDLDITNIRQHFDLGSKNGKDLNNQRKDILFLERCIKHLRPGGRMGIVLPKGDLDEKDQDYVRDYIRKHTKIEAVIGLHKNAFLPYTGDRTTVLLLEKKEEPGEEVDDDHEVFMAVSENPAKNEEGEPIYKRDESGSVITDEEGPVLDTDIYQIIEDYHSDSEPELGYYVSYDELEDRLNPQYYHPKYDQIEEQLEGVDLVVSIEDLLDSDERWPLINGIDISSLSDTGKREYVDEGTPYLRAGDVDRNLIDLEDSNKVEFTRDDLKDSRKLESGDLVISRKGTTGRVSVVTDLEKHSIISSEVMKLRLRDEIEGPDGETRKVDPFYVSAYLNSHIGQLQIKRHLTGSISMGINQTDLKSVRLPLPDEDKQAEIGDKYRRVRDLRTQIKDIDDEARNMCNDIGVDSESD